MTERLNDAIPPLPPPPGFKLTEDADMQEVMPPLPPPPGFESETAPVRYYVPPERRQPFTPDDISADEMHPKKKADFIAWYKLHTAEQNYLLAQNLMNGFYAQVEKKLAVRGFGISSANLRKSIDSPSRIAERDRLVRIYNEKNTQQGGYLPDSKTLAEKVRYEILKDLLNEYDFESRGIVDTGVNFVKKMAAGLASNSINHPFATGAGLLAVFAAPVTLSAVGITGAVAAAGGTVGATALNVAAESLVFAATEIPFERMKNNFAIALRENPRSEVEAFAVNAAFGALIGTGIRGLVSLVRFTGKSGAKVAAKVVETPTFKKAAKSTTEFTESMAAAAKDIADPMLDALSRTLEKALPDTRAEFVAKLKQDLPGSTQNIEQFMEERNSLRRLASAFLDDDPAFFAEVLSENAIPPNPIGSAGFPGHDSLMAEGAAAAGAYKTAKEATEDALVAFKDVGILPENFNPNEFITRGNYDQTPAGRFIQLFKKPGLRNSEEFFQYLQDGLQATSSESGNRAFVSDVATLKYGQIRRFSKEFEFELNEYKQLAEEIFAPETVTAYDLPNLRNFLNDGFTPEQIKKIAAVDIGTAEKYAKLNAVSLKMDIAESLLLAGAGSKKATGKILNGYTVVNNIRNVMNQHIEHDRIRSANDAARMNGRILDIIQAAAKNKNSGFNSVDIEALADSLINNSNNKAVEAAVANELRKQLAEWNNALLARGAPVLENVENYFPNIWETSKVYLADKTTFIKDMLRLTNIEKITALAEKRGRPIKDMEAFFANVYESIASKQRPSYSRAEATGDILSSGDRIIFFKDGASWVEAHEKYGTTTDPAEVIGIISSKVRKKLNLSALGIYNVEEARQFNRSLFAAIRKTATEKAREQGISGKRLVNKLGREIELAERQFNEVYARSSGYILGDEPMGGPLETGIKILRNLKLPTAWLTTALTDFFGSIRILSYAIGNRNAILTNIARNMSKASRKELRQIAAIAEISNQNLKNKMDYGLITRIKNRGTQALTGPLYLNGIAGRFSEENAVLVYTMHLHSQKNLAFEKLPVRTREFLQRNSINAQEWAAFRRLKGFELDSGVKILSAGYHTPGAEISEVVLRKFRRAEVAATLIGATKSTEFGKVANIKPGLFPFARLLAAFVDPFANITYNLFLHQFTSLVEAAAHNKGEFAKLSTHLLLGGYATYVAKQLLQGKNPIKKLEDRKGIAEVLGQVLLYSGNFGGGAEVFINALAGMPEYGITEYRTMSALSKAAITGSMKGTFQPLRRQIDSLSPYRNIGLVSNLAQRYTIDQIFALLDPEGAAAADRKLAGQLNRGEIFMLRYKALAINGGKSTARRVIGTPVRGTTRR